MAKFTAMLLLPLLFLLGLAAGSSVDASSKDLTVDDSSNSIMADEDKEDSNYEDNVRTQIISPFQSNSQLPKFSSTIR